MRRPFAVDIKEDGMRLMKPGLLEKLLEPLGGGEGVPGSLSDREFKANSGDVGVTERERYVGEVLEAETVRRRGRDDPGSATGMLETRGFDNPGTRFPYNSPFRFDDPSSTGGAPIPKLPLGTGTAPFFSKFAILSRRVPV